MKIAYCPNCEKNTGHKRAFGAGTILGTRCIICGLTVEEANPQQKSGNVTVRDKVQGCMVLLGVLLLLALVWRH